MHFQDAVAAERLEGWHALDRHIGRLEQNLAGAQQDTQLPRLRGGRDALASEARAARKVRVAVHSDRKRLTRRLAAAAEGANADAAKLAKATGELVEAGMALAAQRRQTDMLEGRLASVGAEREQLALDKRALVQDKAMTREHKRWLSFRLSE